MGMESVGCTKQTESATGNSVPATVQPDELAIPITHDKAVREALERLVEVKEHKDRSGKTFWYEQEQPRVWEVVNREVMDMLKEERKLANTSCVVGGYMALWHRIKALWGTYLRACKHEHKYEEITGICPCGKQEGAW